MEEALIPEELAKFLIEEDEHDADCTRLFLTGWGFPPPYHWMPQEFLLKVGNAIRLCRWERAGINIHLQVGMLSGRKVLREAVLSLIQPELFPPFYFDQIGALTRERLVWSARETLDTLIEFDNVNEDELADALARFAWENSRVF